MRLARDAIGGGALARLLARCVRWGGHPERIEIAREQAQERVRELDQPRVRRHRPRDPHRDVLGAVAATRIEARERGLCRRRALEVIHRARERAREVGDGVVVVEVAHAAEHVADLGAQVGLAARGRRIARARLVGVGEILDADVLVRERRVERGDQIAPAPRDRLDARHAVLAVLLLLLDGDGLAVHVDRRLERGQEDLVDPILERALRVRVADRMVRDAGDVLAERLRAHAVADHREDLAAQRSAIGGDAGRVELERAAASARRCAHQRSERKSAHDPRRRTPCPHDDGRYSSGPSRRKS